MKYCLHTRKVWLCILVQLICINCFLTTSYSQENSTLQSSGSFKDDSILIKKYTDVKTIRAIPPDSAIALLNTAYVLAKKHRLRYVAAFILGILADTEMGRGNFDNAKRYLDTGFKLSEELKDGKSAVELNSTAANMYQRLGEYAKSATYYFRALEAIQEYKIDKNPNIYSVYNSLGALMTVLHEYDLAKKYMHLALHHLLRTKPVDSAYLPIILTNMGAMYSNTDSVLSSVGYFKEAYRLSLKNKNIYHSYWLLNHLARGYMATNRLDSADYYLRLSKDAAVSEQDKVETEEISGHLAVYKKEYPLAIKHFQTALDVADGKNYPQILEIYEGFSKAYAGNKQFEKAYQYLNQYMAGYEKNLDDPQHIGTDFMLSFQSLEHEKRILEKQAEITNKETVINRRNFWIVAMCMVSVLLGVILAMAYRNYHNKKTLLNQEMHALLQDQEIERLKAEAEGADNERSRIAYDIHDGVLVRLANVKMNLSGLPQLLENNHYSDVVGQLDMATMELRNTAHNLMPEILLEEGLAQAIFYFCKATGQASGVNIKFQQVGAVFPRLLSQVETAIYRIVQGLIQNIIQHAGATTALVQLQYADHLCSVTVEDNGKGMTNQQNEEGYGIKSIRNRIKILKGIFDIESEKEQGTTVYFEFDTRPFLNNSIANH